MIEATVTSEFTYKMYIDQYFSFKYYKSYKKSLKSLVTVFYYFFSIGSGREKAKTCNRVTIEYIIARETKASGALHERPNV